jgi:hypothetical protein
MRPRQNSRPPAISREAVSQLWRRSRPTVSEEGDQCFLLLGRPRPHPRRRPLAYAVLVAFLRVSDKRTLTKLNAFDLS